MVKIWFEPHSTTPDNEAKRASGWNDVDLSELGKQQAKELTERCHERGLDAIFCSDLQRAVKTAVPTASELHIPIYVDARLRECDYGDMTGQPSEIIETERAKHLDTPFPGGQSYRQCAENMAAFCAELQRQWEGKTVLIIGHRATQYGLEICAAGKSLEDCLSMSAQQWKWQPGWEYEVS